jgi:hypothetical protein
MFCHGNPPKKCTLDVAGRSSCPASNAKFQAYGRLDRKQRGLAAGKNLA